MVYSRYKKRLFIVVPVILTMYIIITDISTDPNEGWVYLPSDLQNSQIFRKSLLVSRNDRCGFTNTGSRNPKPVDLRVIIMTYDRPASLKRLLNSLNLAHYGNDQIVIDIWLDRSKSQKVYNQTLQTVQDLKFDKGRCNVHVHPQHVGIKGQWLTTWKTSLDSSELAVILEDDLTVSPYFYSYLKLVHGKYGHRRDIFGFSLQGKTVRHSNGKCCVDVPNKHKVFLYPTLGTSGFSPNKRNWLEFLSWLEEIQRNNIAIPLLKNHISSIWYTDLLKLGMADSMWEMEYLYYTRSKKEFSLYPNFPDHVGLTFNWFEDGLHSVGMGITNADEERKNVLLHWNLTHEQLPDEIIFLDDDGIIK